MQAYLNNPLLKIQILQQLQHHYDADEIIKGTYWENGKGCAIGCILHDSSGTHYRFEKELGIPIILARLIDRIFEKLPNNLAKEWPLKIMSAFETGIDYTKIWYQFAHWLLVDPQDGVIQYAKTKRSKTAIQNVANVYQRYLDGEKISWGEWNKIYKDVVATTVYAAAAANAAAAAADAGAVYAANAAAYAADAAEDAADAAYAAACAVATDAAANAATEDAACGANTAAAAAAAVYAAIAAAEDAADAAEDAAEDAAAAAANDAAYAAAAAAYAVATDAAAYAVANAANTATYAAYAAYAAEDAGIYKNHYIKMSNKLIELVKV